MARTLSKEDQSALAQASRKKEARAHLKRVVKELMKDAQALALAKLETLMDSGAGIVEDQIEAGSTYAIPKDFVVAFCDELKRQTERPYPTRKDKARIKNYYTMM